MLPAGGDFGLGAVVVGAHPVGEGDQNRLQGRVAGRHLLERFGQFQIGGHHGQEGVAIGAELGQDVGALGIVQGRGLEQGGEFGRALLQLVAVFGVVAGEEILFVPAHHQHQHLHRGFVMGFERAFDGVDGAAHRTQQAGVLVEPELALERHHFGERCAVGGELVLEALGEGPVFGVGQNLYQPVHGFRGRGFRLALFFGVGIGTAEQEVLFMAARLEHGDVDGVEQFVGLGRAVHHLLLFVLVTHAGEGQCRHRHHDRDADQADQPDLKPHPDSAQRAFHYASFLITPREVYFSKD